MCKNKAEPPRIPPRLFASINSGLGTEHNGNTCMFVKKLVCDWCGPASDWERLLGPASAWERLLSTEATRGLCLRISCRQLEHT